MYDVSLSSRIARKSGHLPVLRQAAALCYRTNHGGTEVLLITTRKSGRWIIPKGWLIDGLTPSETARQEAWEEAGVTGKCAKQALGGFSYYKHRPKKGSVLCQVDVFPLYVQSMSERFPERGQRQLKWLSPKKAAARVHLADLASLLRAGGPLRH